MFETVATAPPDAILGITEAFQQDPSPQKINLSVGVFKDAQGQTPVLRCVKEAERKLVDGEQTKNYLGIDGLPDYCNDCRELLFGAALEAARAAVVQTPGGTGGLRIAGDFIASQLRGTKVWMSNPTWANHGAIFQAAGLATENYRYLTADRKGLDFEGLVADLSSGPAHGDCVLLHACCHNPTGVDPTPSQWEQIADLISQRGLLPLIDFAYQGFGHGLQEDAGGLRQVLQKCPEVLVVSSFSKNFGLYSERVGAVVLVAAEAAAAKAGLSQLKRLVRTTYSNPPRHGAAIVATVLGDAELTAQWHQELTAMRQRIAAMRRQFVDTMHGLQQKIDFSFLLNQNGMFSFSGLNPMQVDRLRSEHSIYIVGSGRINVAGMTPTNLPRLCEAIVAVLD